MYYCPECYTALPQRKFNFSCGKCEKPVKRPISSEDVMKLFCIKNGFYYIKFKSQYLQSSGGKFLGADVKRWMIDQESPLPEPFCKKIKGKPKNLIENYDPPVQPIDRNNFKLFHVKHNSYYWLSGEKKSEIFTLPYIKGEIYNGLELDRIEFNNIQNLGYIILRFILKKAN